jgi:hypothetical protein
MVERHAKNWILTFTLAIGLFLGVYLAALAIGHNLVGDSATHPEEPAPSDP